MSRPVRVMVFETAPARLARAFAALGDRIRLLLIHADGSVTEDGEVVPLERLQADVIWASFDVLNGYGGRGYFATLAAHAKPQWVHTGAAGYEHPGFRSVVEAGIQLTTSHGQALNMAEYVMAGVLDHFQGGPGRRARQANGEWTRVSYREIRGTTWALIGFGAIGQAVAHLAHAFGAHVVGVKRSQTTHPYAEIAALADLPQILPRADVVVMCVPLTPETRGLADARFFAAMKPKSVFVNVGRGASVDDDALLAALSAGHPEHAVLDVFHTEPLPADHPFWRHPQVVVTPHNSPASDGRTGRNDAAFLENLRRFLDGQPLLNIADPADVMRG